MLTTKQRDLLVFIHSSLQETGVSPSFEEMREAIGLKSKSGVHRLVQALEERGFIRRLKSRARALEIIKLPAASAQEQRNFAPQSGSVPQNGFAPMVMDGGLDEADANLLQRAHREESVSVTLPVMGRIAAGTPISAIQTHLRDVGVPENMLRSGEHYALEIKGDSMIEAGILDGDIAIIQHSENAMNGDIVVAIVDDKEATLKRLRRKGDSIALEAANPAYGTRIFHPSQITVQGRLVGLFREY